MKALLPFRSRSRRVRELRLCFLIPASPTDGFRGQIAMFRRSLDRLGGAYERAQVVAVFGDSTIEELPAKWRPFFERVIVRHADPDDYEARSYYAQSDARWTYVPEDCDFAIMSDADTMVLEPFDDLLERLIDSPGIAGTIAHFPFPQFPDELPPQKWASLGRDWLGGDLPLTYVHSLARGDDPEWRRACPFYLNLGFVVVPQSLVAPIGSTARRLTPQVASQLAGWIFGGQVSLTLAIYAHGVTRHEADIKYNFPNDPLAEELHPASMGDLRVIHYLRTNHFDRQKIFENAGAFDDFMRLPLSGSESLFQGHVRRLTGGRYPF